MTTHVLTPLRMEYLAVHPAVAGLPDVRLYSIGLGAAVLSIPEAGPGDRVIVAGLAGALDPGLRVGDVVLDAPPGVAEGLADDRWQLGRIHSEDSAVVSAGEKTRLFRTTRASAVDMEQARVRRYTPAGVPVIGLRAISDTADMAIDPDVLGLVDHHGRPRPLAVARMLVRRPGLIPHLRELQSSSREALAQLALALPALLERLRRFPPAPAVAYAPPDPI